MKTGAFIFVTGLVALMFHFGDYWSATWWCKWGILFLAFACVFPVSFARQTSWFYYPLLAWLLLSATFMASWAQLTYAKDFDQFVAIVLQKDALFTWLVVVASSTVFVYLTKHAHWDDWARLFFGSLWGAGCLAYIIIRRPDLNGWQLGNPSMGAALLACLLPYVWDTWPGSVFKLSTFAVTFIAVLKTQASIPLGCLFVVTLTYALPRIVKPRPAAVFAACIVFLTGFLIVGKLTLGDTLFDPNGRVPIWQLAYTWQRTHGLLTTGIGAGATQTIMPVLQLQTRTRLPDFFLWLHSDWLQVLFAYGWIGLLGVGLASVRLVAVAITLKRYSELASLAGFAGMALFNYPLRMPLTFYCLFLTCCLIEQRLQSRPESRKSSASPALGKRCSGHS